MTSQFKNTTITGTGALVVAQGTADQRPTVTRTVVSYTSGSGTWTVPAGVTSIELLLVAGGGGGGANTGGASYNDGGGGGGAGGLVYKQNYTVTPGASISYSVGTAGSAGNASKGGTGGNTTFDTLIAYGGGGGGLGGSNNSSNAAGNTGGSGGGSVNYPSTVAGAAATQPSSATSGFGNAGSPIGATVSQQAGGGGGAGGAGGIASYSTTSDVRYSGSGGPGLPFDITGTVAWYAGGGGGGRAINGLGGTGGIGGGGAGGNSAGAVGTAGVANTGGGGGGAGSQGSASAVLGSAGGSGVIHIRYVSNLATANSQGMIRYNSTSNAVEIYQNNEWIIQNPTTNYAGHNMHQNSQDLSSYWTLQGNTLTSSNNVAPDGTSTAALVTTSTGYTPIWKGSVVTLPGVAHTMSGYFKAGTSTFVSMALGNNGLTSTISAIFNFSTQAITGNYSGQFVNGTATYISSSMTSVGNGWYRCSLTGIIDRSSTSVRTDFQMTNSTTTLVWGLQLEQSNILGPYTKTVATATPVPTVSNGDQIHSFTTTGTSYWTPAQSGTVELLVVAGGGGGGYGYYGGGGGAGGLIYLKDYKVIAGTTYTVVVGAGGSGSASSTSRASNGSNSQFGSLIAIGGGGGGSRNNDSAGLPASGNAGGSGGGGAFPPCIGGAGTAGQGFEGGGSVTSSGTYSGYGMGGGGASGPGQSGGWNALYGCQGGGGLGYSISGSLQFYAGGGGGGGSIGNTAGGIGGGGAGGINASGSGTAGTANTGGGGGGSGGQATGGAGGSGIVIVRYKLNTNITGTLDGSSPQRAGVSAAAIKALTSTTTDGYYWINLPVVGPTLVYCDMNTASGGWMHCATFVDNNEAYNNSYNHPWGAPLHNAQYTGIWQDNSILGSQSFISDYKNNVWNYYPMTQQLMKDSGATLRNLWYTGAAQITAQSLSTFWANRRWLADGSDSSPSAVSGGRVHYQTITNFGVNDAVFGSSGLDKILFKYGEYDGTQDGNKDRAMISYVTGNASDVDAPKGIGCHTSLSNDYRFRDIVPTAQNTGDSPPNGITGTHQLTLWVR
jgi:hypothetical protein